MSENNERKFNWELIATLIILVATIVGSTIPLHLHTSSQIEGMRQDTNAQLIAIREEMKDFHGRLCAIEERNKGK